MRKQMEAQGLQKAARQHDDSLGMSRMSWLMALRPLFDSLRAFHNESKKRHVEKSNFLDALQKVKPTLDLK